MCTSCTQVLMPIPSMYSMYFVCAVFKNVEYEAVRLISSWHSSCSLSVSVCLSLMLSVIQSHADTLLLMLNCCLAGKQTSSISAIRIAFFFLHENHTNHSLCLISFRIQHTTKCCQILSPNILSPSLPSSKHLFFWFAFLFHILITSNCNPFFHLCCFPLFYSVIVYHLCVILPC